MITEEVKRQEMDHEEWVKVSRASDEIVKLPLNIVEAGGINATGIQSEALRLNADVIIIDYIGLMKSEGNSRYEKMTNISIDLHTLAQQKKITVIGLSQLNRGGAENKPSMEDLRESGQIEQDADVILLMHKIVNETEVQVDINIAKKQRRRNRNRTHAVSWPVSAVQRNRNTVRKMSGEGKR